MVGWPLRLPGQKGTGQACHLVLLGLLQDLRRVKNDSLDESEESLLVGQQSIRTVRSLLCPEFGSVCALAQTPALKGQNRLPRSKPQTYPLGPNLPGLSP